MITKRKKAEAGNFWLYDMEDLESFVVKVIGYEYDTLVKTHIYELKGGEICFYT